MVLKEIWVKSVDKLSKSANTYFRYIKVYFPCVYFTLKEKTANKYWILLNVIQAEIYREKHVDLLLQFTLQFNKKRWINGWREGWVDGYIHDKTSIVKC